MIGVIAGLTLAAWVYLFFFITGSGTAASACRAK